MKINAFKQIAMATVLLGLNSFVLAEDNMLAQKDNTPQQNDKMQEKKVSPAPTYSPYLGDKMPPYNNPNRFMMEASFIYWQADADGFDFALSQDFTQFVDKATNSISDQTKFQDRRLDFKWDPGFKVGMGVVFGQSDEWDLFLNWTWLRSKAKGSFHTDVQPSAGILGSTSNNLLIPTTGFSTASFSNPFIFGALTGASANWKLQYNTLDLELGRNFFLAKNFTVRPIIGLRGAWIHQRIKVDYQISPTEVSGISGLSALALIPYPELAFGPLATGQTVSNVAQFSGKNNYSGVGLRAGFDMNWNFMEHFCAYSTVSGSVLYGFFDIDEKFLMDTAFAGSSNGVAFDSTFSLDDGYHRTRTNLQVLLGLMWHTGFNNDKQHLSIGVSYEVNEWFQQNELRNFQVGSSGQLSLGKTIATAPYYSISNSRIGGDLGLHGVNFDVKFDF